MNDEMIERCTDDAVKLIEGYNMIGAKTPVREIAITVIKAMREPTDAMLAALHGCLPDMPDKYARAAALVRWQRTIDEALGDS